MLLKDAQKPNQTKIAALHALIQKENAKAKHKVLAFAGDTPNPYKLRRPSGVMQLDIDLGGGLPAGGMVLLAGPEGVGKSVLMYKYMAMQQRIFGSACMIALANIEAPPDHLFMRLCGFQVAVPMGVIDQEQERRAHLTIPLLTKAEVKDLRTQIGTVVMIHEDTGEGILEQILNLNKTGYFNIIGVDSFTAFETDAEAGKAMDENPQQASSASLLTRFTKKYHPQVVGLEEETQNKTTMIGICQVRANRERAAAPAPLQKYIDEFKASVPWSLKHASLITLIVKSGEKVREQVKVEKGEKKQVGKQIGKVIRWRTEKGKAGTHDGIVGEEEFFFGSQINNAQTIVSAGIACGVIKEKVEKGKKLIDVLSHKRDKAVFEDIPGMATLLTELNTSLEFEMRVRQEILNAQTKPIECVYW